MAKKDKDEKPKLASGVYITRKPDRKGDQPKVMAFQGSYHPDLTANGDIVVHEVVPDVANKNDGKAILKMRQFVAAGTWVDVSVIG